MIALQRMGFLQNIFGRRLAALLVPLLGLAGNITAAPPAPVAIAPPGGLFTTHLTVTLTAATPLIRFTLDGSTPTTNSPRYASPLLLTNTTLVKARAFATNAEAGEVAAAAFSLADTNVLDFSSPLPLVVIQTFARSILAPSNPPAWLQVISPGTNQRTTLTLTNGFAGLANLKPRGFSSLRQPKKSLAVETLNPAGEKEAVPLLGMPADSDWILYAPYSDKTLLRDVLAYELSNQFGHYASRTRFVEVFLNDSTNRLARAHYAGVYVLEEKIKIAPARVALQKLPEADAPDADLSGGYIFKKDHLEKAGVDLPPKGPAHSKAPPLIGWFPTGPGGFPGAAGGFLPPLPPPAFADAQSIVTNTLPLTNHLAGTNVIVPAPSVTVVRTNSLVVTNAFLSLTNFSVATNLVVVTNFPVTTNVLVTSRTVIATNPVVAAQSVAGTNTLATTNLIDAVTVVINTTVAVQTSTTWRTNFVVTTNTLPLTNWVAVTNLLVATNPVVVTNVSVATIPVLRTNYFLSTNHYTLDGAEPPPGTLRLVASGEGFVTTHDNAFFFVEPKPAKITDAQRAWLTNYLNRFEAALYGPNFRHPTNGYAAFIDVDSFIDHHLFVEATKNVDGFRFSTYFTKDRGGKIKMEPVWDWNLSFGNAKGKQGYMTDTWYWPQLSDQQYSWFRRLFEDPEFSQRYVDRWAGWRTNVFSTTNVLARLDRLVATLTEPAARNFERWPILGVLVGPEYFEGTNYLSEIQNLRDWTTNRFAWIDAQLVPPPVISHAVGGSNNTEVVSFAATNGQVFFTTDGSDPRLPGGAVSVLAHEYQTPMPVASPLTIVARTRRTNGWSSPVLLKDPPRKPR